MIGLQISTISALMAISGLCEGKKLHVFAGDQQKLNWSNAFKFCQSKVKNLVSTLNKDDHRQLTDGIHKCAEKCGKHLKFSWTAGNDLDNFRQFVWKGINKPVDLHLGNWQPGQPDFANNNEHCVVAWFPDNPKYHQVYLNDRRCDEANHVICEDL